mmetsp:Transcript_11229/g.16606  ORF Transcript_11229/g.16606 Transcript_11229/m.16606 type:complete len:379 (+) Transcript_11229:17-1153(+)
MVKGTLEAIKYRTGHLEVLNQLKIPLSFEYDVVKTSEDGFDAIKSMKVRGAPAIAIVAVLSLAVDLSSRSFSSVSDTRSFILEKLDFLSTSRPTAVNLFHAIADLKNLVLSSSSSSSSLISEYTSSAELILSSGEEECFKMSRFGADYLQKLLNLSPNRKGFLLTHCNTGALACAKYGTALGVIRFLSSDSLLERVFCTETRPYNQGSRLTAFELTFEKIPSTLIADSAVSALLSKQSFSNLPTAIVVGADRIANNGDTANKIGTYQLALSAFFHHIPFFIVAPFSTVDCSLPSGSSISIEERSPSELTHDRLSSSRVVVDGIDVWNPAFDITPAHLISGIITDLGVILPSSSSSFVRFVFQDSAASAVRKFAMMDEF